MDKCYNKIKEWYHIIATCWQSPVLSCIAILFMENVAVFLEYTLPNYRCVFFCVKYSICSDYMLMALSLGCCQMAMSLLFTWLLWLYTWRVFMIIGHMKDCIYIFFFKTQRFNKFRCNADAFLLSSTSQGAFIFLMILYCKLLNYL